MSGCCSAMCASSSALSFSKSVMPIEMRSPWLPGYVIELPVAKMRGDRILPGALIRTQRQDLLLAVAGVEYGGHAGVEEARERTRRASLRLAASHFTRRSGRLRRAAQMDVDVHQARNEVLAARVDALAATRCPASWLGVTATICAPSTMTAMSGCGARPVPSITVTWSMISRSAAPATSGNSRAGGGARQSIGRVSLHSSSRSSGDL